VDAANDMDDFSFKNKILPFSLTAIIIVIDQISKLLINGSLRIGEKIEILGDFLWLWHVRNRGMAFSLGSGLPEGIREILFLVLPIAVLLLLLIYYFKSREIKGVQRWCFTAILGGGLGNLFDRFFRPEGVVDFISVKFYGFLGFERYPTFNVADSTVVIAGIIMVISYISGQKGVRNE
jgi:signal peptidase II